MAEFPQSRTEEILYATINGEEYTGLPESRIEELLLELKEVIEEGGGGGGGTSTIAWKPTVAADGTISWVRTASETKPEDQNIKGPKGDTGETGAKGDTGETGPQGPKGDDGDDGDPGLGIKLVSINQQGHLIITFDDDTTQDAGAIPGGGGAVDSVNGKTGVVVLDAEDIGALPDDTTIPTKTSDLTNDSGFQTASDVATAISGKADSATTLAGYGITDAYTKSAVDTALGGKVDTSAVGTTVASLTDGKIPASQLPSYVDDVIEAEDVMHFPVTGESGKIYVALDTNKTYRWSGSGYVEISESLALGETSSTAYAGNKGKANADAIDAIKDGTTIDSFSDVESALADKADTSDIPEEMPASDMDDVVTPLPSVMSRRFHYSTQEQVVGTWIDGKPIYQKTIYVENFALTTSWKTIDTGITDVIKPIDVYGTFIASSDNFTYALSYGHDSSSYIALGMNSSNYISIRCGASKTGSLQVTVVYTKTTD